MGSSPEVTPMNSSVLRPWCWLSVLLLAQIAVAQECVPGPRGMMGWWRGEGTPASLFDLNPPATTGVGYAAGRVGQGMLLGGAGAGVDLGSPPFLDVQNFTVQAWVRRSSTDAVASDGSATGWIVARGAGGFGFGIGQDGRLQFEAVGMAAPVFSTAAITDTEFHHVAVVRSEVTVTFHLDGVVVGAQAFPTVLGYGGKAAIGRRGDTGTGSFAGMLDEIVFFDRALSAAEVAGIHGAAGAGICLPPVDVANDIPVATERLVQGSGAVGNLTATSDGFGIDGLLRIESAGGGYLSAVAITSGAVTNHAGGVISIRQGTQGPRSFDGPLINRGLFEATWPMTYTASVGSWMNYGELNLTGSGSVSLRGATRLDLVDGAVTGGSALDGNGVDVRFLGGTLSGTPSLLNSRLEFDPRNTHAGSFLLMGSGSVLVGGLRPGQMVTIAGSGAAGNTSLRAPHGLRSAGQVRLESRDGGYLSQINVTGGPLVNEAGGILESTRGAAGPRAISGNLENEGMFRIDWPLSLIASEGTHVNRGEIMVSSGMTLGLSGANQTFRQVAGSIRADGVFDLSGMRFDYEGGEISGTAYLDGVDLRLHPTGTDPVSLILARSSSRVTGRLNANQSLWVRGDGRVGNTMIPFLGGFINEGSLRIESADGGYVSGISVEGGPFENRAGGTLLIRRGAAGPRTLAAELVNDGVVSVQWPATFGRAGAIHRNRANLTIFPGITLSAAGGGQEFRQEAGLLDIQGGLDLSDLRFVFEGGEIVGVPYLDGVRLRVGTATGPGEFNLTRSSSTVEGTLRAGQVLNIRGDGRGSHTAVTAPAGLENEGTIRLMSANGGYHSELRVLTGPMRNRAGGLLHVQRGAEGSRLLTAALENEGTLRISWPMTLGQADAVHVNRGRIEVDTGMSLVIAGANQTFRQEAGVLDGQGGVDFSNIRLDYLAGDITGQPYLDNVRLFIGEDAVRPVNFILGRTGSQVRGKVHVGQSLWIRGDGRVSHTAVEAPDGLAIGGLVRLESVNGGYHVELGSGAGLHTLPGGRIQVGRGADGARVISAPLLNEGALEVKWPLSLGGAGLVHVNRGDITVDPGMELTLGGAGQRLVQEGGTLRVNGAMLLDDDTFRYAGGVVEGTVRIRNSRLELPPSAGPGGLFEALGITTVTGSIPAAVTVTVEGNGEGSHATANLPGGLFNSGVLRVTTRNGGYSVLVSSPNAPVVNEPSGTFEVLRGTDGARRIDAAVVNRGYLDLQWPVRIGRGTAGVVSEGRVRIAPGVGVVLDGPMQLTRGRLDGAGMVTGHVVSEALVAPGSGLATLRVEGSYRQGARGILELELDGAAHDQLVVTGGASLGGLVRVVTAAGFVPEVGRSFAVMTGSLDGNRPRLELPTLPEGRVWRVDYTGGITLRVMAEPGTTPAGSIAGTITDPEGQPVPDLPVLLNVGQTRGLLAEYWPGTTPTGAATLRRVEPTLNNRWGNGSPGAGIGDVFFSRWTGELVAPMTETFQIYTISDDGIRVWIGDTQVINDWTSHPDVENSGTIELEAGRVYPLRVEHYDGGGGATAVLQWSSPSVAREVIPSSALIPPPSAPALILDQFATVTDADGRYDLAVGAGVWTVDVGGLEALGFEPVTPVQVEVEEALVTVDFQLALALGDRLPDLVASAPTASATGVAGQTMEVGWTTSNTGENTAKKPWRESVLLGRQPSGFDAVEIGRFESDEDLAPGTGMARTLIAQLPAGLSGTWYLFIRVDTGLAVDEGAGEVNNLSAPRAIQLFIGDLVVDEVLAPGTLAWGDSVEISWVVRNAGGSPVASPWTDSVYFSQTASGGMLLGEVSPARTTPLAPGETHTNTLRVTIPLNSQNTPGSYLFLVRTDRTGVQPEANDGNNLGVSTPVAFTRPSPPDLAVTAIEVPASVQAGRPVEVRWTVMNLGNTVAVGPWRDVIALAATPEGVEPVTLVTAEFNDPIEPGGTRVRSRQILFPANRAGIHALVVTTDSADQVFEGGDPLNNTRVHPVPLEIAAPDLVPLVVETMDGRLGEALPVSWVIRNAGNAAGEGEWIDRLILVGISGERVLGQWTRPGAEGFIAGTTYTQSVNVTVPLAAGLAPGAFTLRLQSDARADLLESDEGNNTTASAPFQLSLPPLPDLRVATVTGPPTALPGETANVVWKLLNGGVAEIPAGVVVRIDLVPPAPAPIQFLSSVRLETPLAAGAEGEWMTPVRIPASAAGAIVFRVTADVANEVFESDEGNNAGESAVATLVARQLGLVLPVGSIAENATPPTVRARVSRSGPVTELLAVNVSGSDTNELVMPAVVEIAAGSTFAEFDLTVVADGRVDGPKVVQITAAADGFNPGLANLTVLDVDRATLSLLVETNRIREGLTLPVILRRSEAALEPIQIDVGSSSADLLPPATVTLPAGEVEVAFALLAADNDRLEGSRAVQLEVSAPGDVAALLDLEVIDDDDPGLTLRIDPAQIGEADGPMAATATLRRARGLARAQRVRVAVDDPARVVVPLEVIFGAGRDEVSFAVGAVNNRDNDGAAVARVTASIVETLSGRVLAVSEPVTVTVQDDDSAALRLSLGGGVAREGLAPAFNGVITRNSDTALALTVRLSSSDVGEATVPETVVIPAGQTSAPFPVTTLEDGAVDGNQRLTLTAAADGHAPASASLTVTDGDLPDLVFTTLTVAATGITGGDAMFVYRVLNQGFSDAAGPFIQRVYLSRDGFLGADDVLIDEATHTGMLPPGGSFQRDLSRRLPGQAGDWHVIAVVDATGAVGEVLEDNNRAVGATLIRIEPAYTATVETEVNAAPAGTPVPLRGRAVRPGGAAAGGEWVDIQVRVHGTQRILKALTDAEGRFETVFQPLAGEYGRYEVAAGHPGAVGPATQDEFELLGLRPEPDLQFTRIVPGRTNTILVDLRNPNERSLTGIQFEGSMVEDLGMHIVGPTQLEAGGAAPVTVQVWSKEERDAVGRFVVRATSAEGAFITFSVDYTVELPQPRLVARPARIDAGMVRGQQGVIEFEIANIGGAGSGPLDVTLPDLPWLRPASTPPLPGIEPGGTVRITLLTTPDETVPLGVHDGRLAVGNDTGRVSVPFSIRHVSDALGDLEVTAHDENTYYGNGALVAGAAVTLRDVFDNRALHTAVTDTNGTVRLAGLPEGTYNLEVSAPRHDSFLKTITIAPGVLNPVVAFLRTQLVRYNWRVEEVDFQETATIRLETLFETAVPIPVVTIEPAAIDLTGVEGDEHTVEMRITNQGLIAVQSVDLRFEDGSTWRVIPLATDLGAIPPRSSITVPVTFVRIQEQVARGNRLAGPAAGFVAPLSATDCRTPSLGVGWELLCGQFGVAYWSPVFVLDHSLCPPPPLVIARDPLGFLDYIPHYPYVPPPNGGAPHARRGFPIDVGWGPRGFVSHSGTNDCNCLKDGFAENCLSAEAGFKADASAAAQAVLTAVLGPIKWISVQGFEVKFSGSAKLCTCCEEVDGQGVTGLKAEGDVGGSIEAKIFAGPQLQISPPGINVPGLNDAEVEFFVGAGVELTANGSIKLSAKTECFLEKPQVFVDARVQLRTPIGLKGKGKVKGFDPTLGRVVEYEGEAFAGIDMGAYAYYSGFIVGGTGEPTIDGCVDAIVLKAELKTTLSVSAQQEISPKVCLSDSGANAVLASLPRHTEAEAVSRILGFESPDALVVGVTHREEAAAALPADPTSRELSDALVRQLGLKPVGTAGVAGVPVFTQSMASAQSQDEARQSASELRRSARSARPAAGNDGVCAQVKLEIEQQAVVTRKGIGTTLEIINESIDTPLTEIGVSIQIYDRAGNVVNDRFVILPPELTRLAPMGQAPTNRLLLGGLALTLPPDTTGSARWLIVPKDTAAPEEPTDYFVGGHLAYRSGDITKTAELSPGQVTVYPNARLHLKYFHQRDVFADDPFTDEIEPSLPFVLGVMVENRGRGTARNFSITSAQPRIVDNAKGLLIHFDIVATEVAGNAVSPSLTAGFGDIDPGDIAIGRWLLKSSLQGLFIDYEATLEHEDRFGERGASVFEGVEIHELIHQVEADRTLSDGKPDFLVNDVKDPDDLPDTLHLSDGSIHPVTVIREGAADGAPTADDLEVEITLPAPNGWVYLRIPDPARGQFQLDRVRRPDGSSFLAPTNAWVTDRTFIGLGRRPILEHTLHLLDHNSPGRYTLVYRRDESVPDTVAPTSRVAVLPGTSPALIPVRWTGADDALGSGVDSYDIFVSINDGPFQRWLTGTRNQSAFYQAAAGRRYSFYSLARDIAGNVESAPSTPDAFTIATGNSAPELEPVADVTVDEGQRAETQLRATDLDLPGDTLRYELVSGPAGAAVNAETGRFTWLTGEADGPFNHLIRVRVSDDGEPPASVERSFQVIVREVNQPVSLQPVAASYTVAEGTPFRLQLVAQDPDLPANPLRYSLLAGSPDGAVIGVTSGEIVWVPSEEQGGSSHTFEVEVSDQGSPASTARLGFRVDVSKVNSPPQLVAIPGGTVWEGDLVERQALGTDPDLPVQALGYELGTGAASGAALDPGTGRFTWEPLEEHASLIHPFTVIVRDSGDPILAAERTFSIEVRPLKAGLNTPDRALNGDVSFRFKGDVGVRNRLEGSIDLIDWLPLFEFTPTKPVIPLTDRSSAAFPWRYYRVVPRE